MSHSACPVNICNTTKAQAITCRINGAKNRVHKRNQSPDQSTVFQVPPKKKTTSSPEASETGGKANITPSNSTKMLPPQNRGSLTILFHWRFSGKPPRTDFERKNKHSNPSPTPTLTNIRVTEKQKSATVIRNTMRHTTVRY
ncbi:hypothetical protein, unlikely [Trypanosoma brucei gambiense DAL972]|uniref:Uncharacterized protein n=1 Tax=Trypanosoma brucei gambiense (strain MHOM/CI/86/DAL972) TaxID=679716 RepID=C9ZMJ2_TRYB9|nr:hypothetical protein, unlikely [Trypanosoma brucei gambiense DAL972]CBH10494.1 hypothetical protein, unlikely [Trypanosoma brucei gambiense DAL972]|eukprot:XP_011772784.1 hypothetical protein, unlikely [Trypanosoma brucei gambiense DAL972]